jgi:hypothetical protein
MTREPLPGPDHDDDDTPRRWSLQWWFARLAFSFLIVGFIVGYEGYHAQQRGESARATIMMIGAAAGIALGIAGLRAWHRR